MQENEKMQEQDTAAAETEAQEQLGTGSDIEATSTEDAQAPEDKVAKAEYEALVKERDKVAQERNMLRKKVKEAELGALEKSGQIEEAYNKLKADYEEQEARLESDRAQREAETFRKEVIDAFPNTKVREAASRLIAKNPSNFVWSDGATPEQAKTELLDQLNSLAELTGEDTGTDQGTDSKVSANNPMPDLGGKRPEDMSLEELQKLLPKAAPR